MINLNGTTTGYGANTAELANADIRVGNSAAPTNGIYSPAANQLALSTAGTGRLFVDASGRLLVGTSTARNSLFNVVNTYGGLFQVEGTGQFGGTRGAAVITNNSSSAGAFPYLALARANGDSIGSTTIVSNGHTVGALSFQGCDGLEFVESAKIEAAVDGAPGANDMPGRLVFSTTADGAAAPTEAMRINNQRELLIGTTTRTANGGVLQISNGITFPGTQSACSDPNTLDDYEEGTWTPAYQLLTTDFDAVNYNAGTLGRYTKIGKAVIAHCFIVVQDFTLGSGTGNLAISGLPFTVENVSTNPTGATVCTGTGWTNYPFAVRAIANTTRMDIYVRSTANGTAVNATQVDLPAATGGGNRLILSASISYRAT